MGPVGLPVGAHGVTRGGPWGIPWGPVGLPVGARGVTRGGPWGYPWGPVGLLCNFFFFTLLIHGAINAVIGLVLVPAEITLLIRRTIFAVL